MSSISFNYGDIEFEFKQQKGHHEMIDCFRNGLFSHTTSFHSLFFDSKEMTEKRKTDIYSNIQIFK